jgi:hypothetical protein
VSIAVVAVLEVLPTYSSRLFTNSATKAIASSPPVPNSVRA